MNFKTQNLFMKVGVVLFFLLSVMNVNSELKAQKKATFRLVIDPGHGGHNDGTTYRKFKEKDLNLKISKKVGQLIKKAHPEVRVLYTRSTDVFKTLKYRPRFSTRLGADLFLSIHANHEPSRRVSGTETFVLPRNREAFNRRYIKGRSKRRIQMMNRSKSIEMATYLEEEYKRLGKHSRGVRVKNLQVLRENGVPAVLTEVGFLSSAKDRKLLCTRSGQLKISKAIARAFSKYYKRHRKVASRSVKKVKKVSRAKSAVKTTKTPSARLKTGLYRVQFMATHKWINTNSKEFKRLGVSIHRTKDTDGLYRYSAGGYRTLYSVKKLRTKMRRYYKDCFIIRVDSKGRRLEAIY